MRPATLPATDAERLVGKALEREYNLADLLRRPAVSYDQAVEAGLLAAQHHARLRAEAGKSAGEAATSLVMPSEGAADVSRETKGREALAAELGPKLADSVIEQVEISIKYAGYIDKQNEEVERAAYYENLRLPEELDYMTVSALSHEARQKLNKHRPETLGQASRLSGITPAAISLLLIHLKKGRFKGFGGQPGESAAPLAQATGEAA